LFEVLQQEELEDTTRINHLNKLAGTLIKSGMIPRSRVYIMQALQYSNSISFKEGYLEALTNLADFYLHQEKADSALIPIQEALSLVSDAENRTKFMNLEATAYRMAGQPVHALEIYNKALELADSLSNEKAAIGIQLNMATIYKTLGNYSAAYEAYFNGLKHAENTGDTLRLAIIHNNIGDTYNSEGKYEQALYHLNLSENLSYKIDLTSNLTRVYLNLGNTYKHFGDFDKALNYYSAAAELYEKTGDIAGSARINYNRGLLEMERGNKELARDYLLKSFEESSNRNIAEGIFYSSFSLGNLEFDQKNYSEADKWYNIALDIAEKMQAGAFRMQIYEKLYLLSKETNTLQALQWLESLKELTDSLRSSERDRIRAEYDARFEMERREQENEMLSALQAQQQSQLQYQKVIILASIGGFFLVLFVTFLLLRSNKIKKRTNSELQLKNKQLKRLNSTIRDQNKELENLDHVKNKLFAIIAHDLRGPLSSLQSLLYLLREHDLSKEELSEISHSLEVSLQENASTMDNLLAWAKAQMSGITLNARKFAAKKNLDAVYSQIRFQADQKNVSIEIDVDEHIFVEADYDMLKLIVRNLISNAIKFSKKGDTITVSAKKKEEKVIFSVRDEGVGISEADKHKIFASINYTSRGTANEKGSGLGLSLCKEFAEKHDGKIWFESNKGEGTTFYFTIPAAKIEEPHAVS
ncbi:MAG: ATP-binding protein, partial [Balneolaceae bacterium]